MNRRRRRFGIPGASLDLTPMIDVVFLLLIFFTVTAVFIEIERRLATPLPRDHGLLDGTSIPLAEIRLELDWIGANDSGRCVARATTGAASSPAEVIEFASVTPGPERALGRVDYVHPDFAQIREHLAARAATFDEIGVELPVTIRFAAAVPVQMVVSAIDACRTAGIRNCGIAATP